MLTYLRYFLYLLKHKYYVFVEACKLGIPLRGLLHDVSKLYPSEFVAYANHFYGKGKKDEDAFRSAWLHHQHRNPHHWQHWILRNDDGTLDVLDMPLNYRKEMLADWRGAGKAIKGFDDTTNWYLINRYKIWLHPATREWIERELYSSSD